MNKEHVVRQFIVSASSSATHAKYNCAVPEDYVRFLRDCVEYGATQNVTLTSEEVRKLIDTTSLKNDPFVCYKQRQGSTYLPQEANIVLTPEAAIMTIDEQIRWSIKNREYLKSSSIQDNDYIMCALLKYPEDTKDAIEDGLFERYTHENARLYHNMPYLIKTTTRVNVLQNLKIYPKKYIITVFVFKFVSDPSIATEHLTDDAKLPQFV